LKIQNFILDFQGYLFGKYISLAMPVVLLIFVSKNIFRKIWWNGFFIFNFASANRN